MSQKLFAFTLLILLALNCIYCKKLIDNISLNKFIDFQMTQEDLQSQANSNSNIYWCKSLNQYTQTMANNGLITQTSKLLPHNYVRITFDAIFLNIQRLMGGVKKQIQIDVNGNKSTFEALVLNDNYQCMVRSDSNKVDGKAQFSLNIPHTGDLNLTFSPISFGTVARLGISNIQIEAYLCGKNAQLDSKSTNCVCLQGFSTVIIAHIDQGINYFEKSCI